MAQSVTKNTMMDHDESCTAATIFRNDDSFTRTLRSPGELEMEDLAKLHRPLSPTSNASVVGTSAAKVFSHPAGSTSTKPTSTGTAAPYYGMGKGKGNMDGPSTSSLSVGHGSFLEAEAVQGDTLFGMGEWTKSTTAIEAPTESRPKDDEYEDSKPAKIKKPRISILPRVRMDIDDVDSGTATAPEPFPHGSEPWRIRRRATQHEFQYTTDAEQVPRPCAAQDKARPLSNTRRYLVATLVLLIFITLALSVRYAYHFGRGQMACTKGIIMGASVLVVVFTVVAMHVARRALQEALLAGLLEIAIGFILLQELNDLMGPQYPQHT
ncbi:hypothetical protein ACN47E_009421 [Coniothyrium glycines]